MRALLFIGQWGWVAVLVAMVVIGTMLIRTLGEFEDETELASELGTLRQYQERMLQAQMSEWLMGEPAPASPVEIAEQAEQFVAELLGKHQSRGDGPILEREFDAAVEAALDELWSLAELQAGDADAEQVAALQRAFGLRLTAAELAGVTGSLGSESIVVVYGALRYAAASARITRHLDTALDALAADSAKHSAELRQVSRFGIGFLLIGGVLSAAGYAWAGHRARRDRWEAERARERAALGSEFVALASHELRTPLVGIYGFSELLLEDEAMPPHSRNWVERIHVESARLGRIVQVLLVVSRIDSGRLDVRRKPVNFGEVVDSVYGAFEGASPLHHLRIRGDLAARVVGDQDKLVGVLSNLVDNAIKYSIDGGLVVIEGRVVERRFEVRVIDEGVGIPATRHAEIFERFSRLRRSETEHVRSTGLGLYLVRQTLLLMDATISVESSEGVGSTFVFSLPLAAEESDKALDDAAAA